MYQLLLYRNEYSLAHCSALFPTFFFFNLFVLWDAFMICNYIPAKLLNFFFNHLKVWLPYCLRKFLWTSLSAAPDFEKKRKQRALKTKMTCSGHGDDMFLSHYACMFA